MSRVRIGVLGAGHLGKIHLRLLAEIDDVELVGFHDPNPEKTAQGEQSGLRSFSSLEEMLPEVDAVDVVTPTLSHFDVASRAVMAGKHVFIEKPVTNTVDEAKSLAELVEKHKVKAQVGHVERFNPAFLSVNDGTLNPLFIETHRLAQFNPRGTDVPVVHDLMVHDIDVVLSIVKSPVESVSASGVSIISDSPDIASARLEFANGCVANLTASRISLKQMRKMRLFQQDAYISVDFLKKKSQVFRLRDADVVAGQLNAFPLDAIEGLPQKAIVFEEPESQEVNAIKMELELFAQAILEDKPTAVPVSDGLRALEIAEQVMRGIEARLQRS